MERHGTILRLLGTATMTLALVAGGLGQIRGGRKVLVPIGREIQSNIHLVHLAPKGHGRAMREFSSSSAHRLLQSKFATSWQNPSKTIVFGDGTRLRIRMASHPNLAGGDINIQQRKRAESTSEQDGWQCTSEKVKLTADSTTFLNNDYGNGNARIYPGAVFAFEDFYSGNYREARGERAPLTLVTDNPNINGSSSVTVASPGLGTCRDAIAAIYRRFTRDAATESSASDVTEANNDAELTMKVSGGASGFGASFKAAFGMERQERTYSLTVDARKSLYSITALPGDAGFFKDPNAAKTGNLMAVGNVVYGVRVLANVNVTFKSSKDALDFQAAYNGVGYSAEAAMNYVQSHSSTVTQVHAYVVGGPGASEVWFSPNQVKSGISAIMNGATFQNARPISYQFVNMAGDLVGTQSATDEFTVRHCTPVEQTVQIVSARVKFVQGNDGKNKETDYELAVEPKQNGPTLLRYMTGDKRNKYEYKDNSTVYQDLDMVKGPIDAGVFPAAGGGKVTLYVNRKGHNDNWKIDQLTIYLTLSDGSETTHRLRQSGDEDRRRAAQAVLQRQLRRREVGGKATEEAGGSAWSRPPPASARTRAPR